MKVYTKENLLSVWQNADDYFRKIGICGMSNLTPVAIINDTLFVEFTGEPEESANLREVYKANISKIETSIKEMFQVAKIENANKLSKEKLSWLKELIDAYQPKGVEFKVGL